MAEKPIAGQARHLFERARFLEQVGGAGNHRDFALDRDRGQRLPVQLEDRLIAPADYQQGRAFTLRSNPFARSGRPPRDTTAVTLTPGCAAAARAAPAPVLAPKYPTGNDAVSG